MSTGYLIINIASAFVPLVFSFHPKLKFYKEWKYFLVSAIITAIPFIIWDIYFTDIGVWGFNPDYLTGFYLVNLPLEEVLFFICIPFACVFTYFCLTKVFDLRLFDKIEPYISYSIVGFLIFFSVLFFENLYTRSTFITLTVFILFLKTIAKPNWLGQFYFVFVILLLPFLIVNGLLTGSFLENPIVWYDDSENMSFRIFTIPFEDFFYALLMLGLNVFFYEKFRKENMAK